MDFCLSFPKSIGLGHFSNRAPINSFLVGIHQLRTFDWLKALQLHDIIFSKSPVSVERNYPRDLRGTE